MPYIVKCSWYDGDVVYRRVEGDGTVGTRLLADATEFDTKAEADKVANSMLGGTPEFSGNSVDVVPV